MSYIRSFTEMGMLNTHALNLLCPPNCEKTIFESPCPSVLETVEHARKNIFLIRPNTSDQHIFMKPVRFVARMLYTLAVTAILSPCGASFYGVSTLFNATEWAIAKYRQNDEAANSAAKKTKMFARACFTDLTGCAFFASAALVMASTAMKAVYLPAAVGLSAVVLPGVLYYIDAFQPENFITRFVAGSKQASGMYLSLALRNQLGLCGPNGAPLPYAKADRITCTGSTIKGPGFDKLLKLGLAAELEFLDAVKEAASWTSRRGVQLEFQYPFSAEKVENALRKVSYTVEETRKVQINIKKIQMLDRKVVLLKGITDTIRNIVANPSPQAKMVFLLAGAIPQTYTFTPIKSFIKHSYYTDYFSINSSKGGVQLPISKNGFFSLVTLDAWDPKTHTRGNTLYDQFNYDVRTSKFKEQNGAEPSTFHELFGLTADSSYQDYKKSYRQLALAIHPDRNSQREEEATELWKVVEAAKSKLEDEHV